MLAGMFSSARRLPNASFLKPSSYSSRHYPFAVVGTDSQLINMALGPGRTMSAAAWLDEDITGSDRSAHRPSRKTPTSGQGSLLSSWQPDSDTVTLASCSDGTTLHGAAGAGGHGGVHGWRRVRLCSYGQRGGRQHGGRCRPFCTYPRAPVRCCHLALWGGSELRGRHHLSAPSEAQAVCLLPSSASECPEALGRPGAALGTSPSTHPRQVVSCHH